MKIVAHRCRCAPQTINTANPSDRLDVRGACCPPTRQHDFRKNVHIKSGVRRQQNSRFVLLCFVLCTLRCTTSFLSHMAPAFRLIQNLATSTASYVCAALLSVWWRRIHEQIVAASCEFHGHSCCKAIGSGQREIQEHQAERRQCRRHRLNRRCRQPNNSNVATMFSAETGSLQCWW